MQPNKEPDKVRIAVGIAEADAVSGNAGGYDQEDYVDYRFVFATKV